MRMHRVALQLLMLAAAFLTASLAAVRTANAQADKQLPQLAVDPYWPQLPDR